MAMEQIAISKFKATCLAVIERVRKTGKPILITRFGQPVAQIGLPEVEKRQPRLGWGVGTAEILGDIVGPVLDLSDIEAMQEPTEDNESGRYR
jgi:antitoxin (DNA-binding transcriptional repressor) of toxin-antitoxin stability system